MFKLGGLRQAELLVIALLVETVALRRQPLIRVLLLARLLRLDKVALIRRAVLLDKVQ